jgi:hypothetical protein
MRKIGYVIIIVLLQFISSCTNDWGKITEQEIKMAMINQDVTFINDKFEFIPFMKEVFGDKSLDQYDNIYASIDFIEGSMSNLIFPYIGDSLLYKVDIVKSETKDDIHELTLRYVYCDGFFCYRTFKLQKLGSSYRLINVYIHEVGSWIDDIYAEIISQCQGSKKSIRFANLVRLALSARNNDFIAFDDEFNSLDIKLIRSKYVSSLRLQNSFISGEFRQVSHYYPESKVKDLYVLASNLNKEDLDKMVIENEFLKNDDFLYFIYNQRCLLIDEAFSEAIINYKEKLLADDHSLVLYADYTYALYLNDDITAIRDLIKGLEENYCSFVLFQEVLEAVNP